jgi:hypothetical protein
LHTPPSTLAFDRIAKRPRKEVSAHRTNIEIHNHLGRDSDHTPLSDHLGQRHVNTNQSPSEVIDLSYSDSDENELIHYPPISEVLTDLHTAMPLVNYPRFEEALVNNGIVYANSVHNISSEFFSTIIGMPVGMVHDFKSHAKRLMRRAKKAKVGQSIKLVEPEE